MLQVADTGFDIRSQSRFVEEGEGLVGDEDACQVIVALEGVKNGTVAVNLRLVPVGRCLFELRVESIKVEKQIDSYISKGAHAVVVIGCRVNMVDPDSVGVKGSHEFSISLALVAVDQRIIGSKLVRNAWIRKKFLRADTRLTDL